MLRDLDGCMFFFLLLFLKERPRVRTFKKSPRSAVLQTILFLADSTSDPYDHRLVRREVVNLI